MEILYEDAHVIVAVKPVGVLSEYHATEPSMPRLLSAYGEIHPVHRLDRTVGGVMVFARTRAAAARLSASVQSHALCKQYTAIVSGEPTPREGTLRDYLFKDAAANKSFVVDRARKGVKEAVLSYAVEATVAHGEHTLSRVSVRLETGRSHQIRVQFASRGYPLVGDGKYGSRCKAKAVALYATSLTFPHPASGENMQFSTPVPDDFPWNLFGSSAYEIERKYLVEYPDVNALAAFASVRIKKITQTYLAAPEGASRRVRRVCEGETVRYIETVKRRVSDLRAVEEERELSLKEYEALLALCDPSRRPIEKTRYCLPYEGKTVEVDLYAFWQDRATAEVELASEEEHVSLPPCLHVIREVTADKRYKNVNLARELPVD